MKKFLLACMARIPYRTGFLLAAFQNMQEYFNRGEVKDVTKLRGPSPFRLRAEYYYHGKKARVQKFPANALQFVKPQNPAAVIQTVGDIVTMQFDIDISYFRINDNYRVVRGTPWRAMDAGFQAAINYLETASRRFPDIEEVLVTAQMALRGERVTKTSGYDAAKYRGRFGSNF
jgi:hypothetical protein